MAAKSVKNYFSHDANARNDDRILRLRMRHGAAGYGVYFMVLERLREETDYMSVKDYNMIAFDLRVDSALIKSVIEDFGLFAFTQDGECFYSDSFLRRMEIKDERSRRRSAAGRRGNSARWGSASPSEPPSVSQCDSKRIANASHCDNSHVAMSSQTDSNAIASHRKESKVKKSKVKITSTDADVITPADAPHASSSTSAAPALYSRQKIPIEDSVRAMLADSEWRDSICMKNHLSADALDSRISEWEAHSRCLDQSSHESVSHAKRHFYQWLLKQLTSKPPNEKNTADRGLDSKQQRDAEFTAHIVRKLQGS